jgi:hypothetical protein
MELISLNNESNIKRIFATAHGISDSDARFMKNEIKKYFSINDPDIVIEVRNDLTCKKIFDEYWMTLTAH